MCPRLDASFDVWVLKPDDSAPAFGLEQAWLEAGTIRFQPAVGATKASRFNFLGS